MYFPSGITKTSDFSALKFRCLMVKTRMFHLEKSDVFWRGTICFLSIFPCFESDQPYNDRLSAIAAMRGCRKDDNPTLHYDTFNATLRHRTDTAHCHENSRFSVIFMCIYHAGQSPARIGVCNFPMAFPNHILRPPQKRKREVTHNDSKGLCNGLLRP